jgi:hypothetical protein
MPLFFFDIYNDAITLDDEGYELVDAAAARAHAIKAARSLMTETVTHGHLTRHHRIDVCDAEHVCVDTVRFDEAVDIRP